MQAQTTDIFISGAGIAGLSAALGFANAGFQVALADPSPPPRTSRDVGSDLRSTAFLQPARGLLESFGAWDALDAAAMPLETLRVINCAGTPPEPKSERAFQSIDLGQPAFGWNLPNWLTRSVLTDLAVAHPGIDLRLGTGFYGLLTRDREALVTLSDQSRLKARLAVAADGRASPLREAAGIETEVTRYGQKALAFAVSHEVPHENVSTELYLSGGAFVLVPLPDHDGKPASAVVWMNDGPEATRLKSLDADALSKAATERACHLLGDLTLISPVNLWPVVTQRATRLTAQRTALVAEAAHVLPPIGAQGLNTSLQDIGLLLDLAIATPEDLGSHAMLATYEKRRARDIHARARVIDLYNRICRSDAPPVQDLRTLGLRLVHDVTPLRKAIMRAGMGG